MFSGGMEIEVKMKKRKILIAMLSVFIAVFPTACGNPDSSESGNKKPLASFGNLWEMKAGESDGKADILLKEITITPEHRCAIKGFLRQSFIKIQLL